MDRLCLMVTLAVAVVLSNTAPAAAAEPFSAHSEDMHVEQGPGTWALTGIAVIIGGLLLYTGDCWRRRRRRESASRTQRTP